MQSNVQVWTETKRLFADYVPAVAATKIRHVSGGDHPESASRGFDVAVVKMDTLQAASHLENPLILIFADAHSPGGCVEAGAGMQEESLFRRSALHKFLVNDLYPIEEDACVYAQDVPVLHAGEKLTHSFIACPGIKMPWLDGNNRFREDDARLFRKKVELICQVAIAKGHKNIVLGALGCGVWGCPPKQVAEIFKETLLQYDGSCFENVTFAILGGNFNEFNDVLK